MATDSSTDWVDSAIAERQRLIEFLVEDWANSVASDGFSVVREVILYGFEGYYNMTLAELQQQADDAGYDPELYEDDDEEDDDD